MRPIPQQAVGYRTTWDNEYYPYGGLYSVKGGGTDYDFLGKNDPGIGLHNIGPRWYNSFLGRFLSPDPLLSAPSAYAYGHGNPAFFSDPSGMMDILPHFSDAQLLAISKALIAKPRDLETRQQDQYYRNCCRLMGYVAYGGTVNDPGSNIAAAPRYVLDGTRVRRLYRVDVFRWQRGTAIYGDAPEGRRGKLLGSERGHYEYVRTEIHIEELTRDEIQDYFRSVEESGGKSYYETALTYEGTPYRYGGMTREGIDCSGLVNVATGHEERVWSTKSGAPPGNWSLVSPDNTSVDTFRSGLAIGDLLVFTDAGHAAFYAGNDALFHARRTDTYVGYTGGGHRGAGFEWWYNHEGVPVVYRQVP